MRLRPFALLPFLALFAANCARIQELGSKFFKKEGAITAQITATNLTGRNLGIQINQDTFTTSASPFVVSTNVPRGEAYTISIVAQPVQPAQTCTLTSPANGTASGDLLEITLNCTTQKFTVSGTVTGYAGSGLQVQLNGGEIVSVSGSSFSFAALVDDSSTYNVQTKTNPTGPAQICTAQRNVGIVTGANVTDVSINCSTVTYSVGGFVSGLASGASVTVQVNGAQSTARSADGFFAFTNKLADQTAFDLTVVTQPTGQTCSVGRGAGTLNGEGYFAAIVQCSATTYTVSGTLSGLSGGYTTLVSSTGEFLPVTANGAFTFAKNLANGSDYVIEIFRNPAAPAQTCTVTNGIGTIGGNVSNVAVNCTSTGYTIGGTSTIGGLTSAGLVLRLNGASDTIVPANATSFSFSETIAAGSNYAVTIAAQPSGQKCTLSNASGTAGAAVTNVTVSCVNGYTVGGTVTGYSGSNLVLRNTINGTPLDLVISSSSTFTFPDLLVAGDTYAVSVANHPETPYQNCSIANASGTIAAANITNVNITCTNVTVAFTATSSSVAENVGGGTHTVNLSFSGATPRSGSVQVQISGGTATDTLDFSLAATTLSWSAGAAPGNLTVNITDDAFNEGNETIQISLVNPVGITLGAQTTHTVTINDDDAASAVGAVITAAEYYDADRNGKIDSVKITFDKAVKDSSQVGWVNATTNISVASQWLIAGYSGVQFVPQVCIDRSVPANGNCSDGGDITDVVDNNVIWLNFTEGATYDTGATPDLTGVDVTLKTVATSPNDCYVYTSGATCQTVTSADFATGAVAEADKAEPILVAAWSDPIIDSWQLRLQFSEAVDLSAGVGACSGTVTNAAFTYTNVSGGGTSALRTDFADNNGCDITSGSYYVTPRVDARFTNGDLYPSGSADTIALASTFYDSLGNASVATTKTITYDPYLELYYPMNAAAPLSDTNSIVHDVSGHGRHGTITGGAKLVKDMGENQNQAYGFPAASDNITATGYKGILARNSRTVAIWIKAETDNSIIGWGTSSSGADFKLIVKTNSPKGTFQISTFGGGTGGNLPAQGTGWRHFAATYDQADGTNITNAKLYVDGALVTSLTNTSVTLSTVSGADLYITNPRNGKTDEVRLYSRALTATEIKKLATKVPSGLVAQYPLDDNLTSGSVADSSGNGNDATINGNPLPGADRYGRATSAYVFDGTGDLLRKTSANSLPDAAAPRTICGWFNRSNLTSSVILADTGASTATVGNMFRIVGLSGGQIKSDFYTSANSDSSAASPAGIWSHVCGVYDGSTNKSYLNGQESPAASYTATASATTIALGGTVDFTNILVGSLDDIQIYNRALTAGEVKALATELDRGLVAYYPLDDAATTAKDYSGSGNDLTATNSPTYVTDRNGNTNGAYHFTRASSQSLDRTGFSNLSMGSTDRTLCAWAKFDSMTANYQSMIGYGNASTGNSSTLILDTTNNTPAFDSYNNTLSSSLVSTIGTWQHMCATYSGSTPSVYVNGKLEASGTITTINTTGTSLKIGRSIGTQYLDGAVDDARIYNRVLSLAEIRELSGFAPGQVDNQTFWLDAGRAVFNDAGTTLATNTQSVQQWNDISFTNGTANAKDVSQGTSTKRPSWQSAGINNQPVLRFDGTADVLTRASVTGTTLVGTDTGVAFVVQKQDSSGTDATTTFIWNAGVNNRFNLHLSEGPNLYFDQGDYQGGGRVTAGQPAGWDDAFHITQAYRSGTNGQISVDGTLLNSTTLTDTLTNTGTATMYVGAITTSAYFFKGDIAEIIIYSTAITATERDKITCYLSKKYAIAVSTVCD